MANHTYVMLHGHELNKVTAYAQFFAQITRHSEMTMVHACAC